MEYLKEGIGLRAMAQRDPLVEYQREGFVLFQSTMGQIKEESLGMLYNLEVQVRPAEGPEDHVHLEGGGLEEEKSVDDSNFSYTAPSEDGGATVSGGAAKAGKSGNPAKSGKKAKASAASAAAQQAAPAKAAKAEPAARGAFGQQVEGEQPDTTNRAERRKKK
jgi:preprotein translocase subunit SecA